METLTDVIGTKWELIDINEQKVRLQNQRHGEISEIYKREFIENAIKEGLLERQEKEVIKI